MIDQVRAKFVVQHVEPPNPNSNPDYALHQIRLGAVYEGDAEKQARSENAIFGKATPAGQMTMAILPPEVARFFEPGAKYYLDFTRAPD